MLRKFLVLLVCVGCSISIIAQQENSTPLVNSDVVKMIKAGLPESTIVLSIQQSTTNFDTSPQALIDMKNQGAGERVLEAILQAGTKKNEQAAKTTPLEKPKSDNSTSRTNSVSKVNQYDFEFEFSGCKNAGGGDIICNFTINNKGTFDRQIVVLNESRLIDDFGNEYPTVLTRIGNASQNFGSWFQVEGTTGILIPQTVTMASIQFKQVNPNAKLAKVLRLGCRWERPDNDDYNFTVDFRDVPLTSFTSSLTEVESESRYEASLASILKGERVSFDITHQHSGPALGMDADICAGKLILSKDFLEFQGNPSSYLNRNVGYHDFKAKYNKIYEIIVIPEKFGKLHMRIGIEKKNGKEENKEFNFYSDEAALLNTGLNSPYYSIQCDRKCTEKAQLIKKLIDKLITDSKSN